METDTAFVRADSVVELYAVAEIGLHFAFIVHPRHTESKDTVGFDQSFYDFGFFKFRMLIVYIFNGQKNLFDSLKILRFTGMFCLQRGHDFLDVHDTIV